MASPRSLLRFPLLLIALVLLILAMLAGLSRLGWQSPLPGAALAIAHGPLMVCGFLGTLISLERAVALRHWWAYAAPAITAAGALSLIAGASSKAAILAMVLGSFVLVLIFAEVLATQFSFHNVTMAIGAVAWLVGNALWLRGGAIPQIVEWWVGFLVLTIAGERLELSRLLAPPRFAKPVFTAGLAVIFAGLICVSLVPEQGHRIVGAGMIILALWMARFDVARVTVQRPGLPRFIALSLFGGYVWLGVGGLVRILAAPIDAAGSLPYFMYDAMLHSIFLGFVFSMIFAHAPIIFPAVTGRALPFRHAFYAHVVLLHLSMVARLAGDVSGSRSVMQWAGFANVIAIVLFLASSAYSMAAGKPALRGRNANRRAEDARPPVGAR